MFRLFSLLGLRYSRRARRQCCAEPGAELSGTADTARDPVRAGRRDRHHRAHTRAQADQTPRTAGRRGQPRGRGRKHRGGTRGAGAARRLHAAGRQHFHQFDQSDPVRQADQGQCDQGPYRRDEAGGDPEFHPRQPENAGQYAERGACVRQEPARPAQLSGAARFVLPPRHAGADRGRGSENGAPAVERRGRDAARAAARRHQHHRVQRRLQSSARCARDRSRPMRSRPKSAYPSCPACPPWPRPDFPVSAA